MKLTFKNTAFALVLPLMVLGACDSDDDDTDTDTDTVAVDEGFNFSTNGIGTYTRVDRMGMPAVATALITSKDTYNNADPSDDAAGTFVPEIVTNLQGLHDALDDDLVAAGLVPCVVDGGNGSCVTVAGPLIIPDTLSIDSGAASGFPNGRLLADPVIDVTLAVALLELTQDNGQSALTLASIPLGPPANDAEFSAEFPYLAAPN